MSVSRRAVLLGGALVAGCAPTQGSAPAPSTGEPSLPVTPPAEPSLTAPPPSPTPSPSPSPTPSPTGGLPSRQEIIARFDGERPSEFGLEVDGVVLRTEASGIALTFDACGGKNGSRLDEELVSVLREAGVAATLFVNSRWIEANPGVVEDLAKDFEIANHGTRHVPICVDGRAAYGITGTASVGEVYDEVAQNQLLLTELLGEGPRWFRSGTAHVDDVAARIVDALGLRTVNFDINGDAGATFTPAQVRSATVQARPGSIVIGHCNRPGSGTAEGMRRAIAELLERGERFITLSEGLDSHTMSGPSMES